MHPTPDDLLFESCGREEGVGGSREHGLLAAGHSVQVVGMRQVMSSERVVGQEGSGVKDVLGICCIFIHDARMTARMRW